MAIQVSCGSCGSSFNAPDSAAGKQAKCPKCGGPIKIPVPAPAPTDEILDAELAPSSPYDDDDFAVEPPPKLPDDVDRKPCPKCGEMIQRNAMKCRFCGEILDPLLRAQSGGVGTTSNTDDADLTVADWVLCILCSGIGCILAIIYIIQGKPKGTKMLMISLAVQAFWVVVRVALMSAQQ
jgi:predicted RNA-binding Zn-ribbon protein involved in translation (DUF1610 family)